MKLGPIRDPDAHRPLDWTFKGLAAAWDGLTPAEVRATETCLFDDGLMMPAATLKRSSVENNRRWMRQFLAFSGALLAPHGKTTLAPALFRQQAEDGAWAITAATAHHARLYRRFGVSRIFLANQLIGAANIAWIIDELAADPGFDFYCLVDSAAGVEQLADVAGQRGCKRELQLLVEMGRPGGRCGARSVAEGLEVARAVAAHAPLMSLVGVETFEGVAPSAANAVESVRSMLEDTVELARACEAEGLFSRRDILLSAGGSAFFDLAAAILADAALVSRTQLILRSGCYITHDDGTYERLFEALRARTPEADRFGPGLTGALQIWAHVQSVPQPNQLVCAFGRRDVGTETDMPKVVAWARPGDKAPRAAPPGLMITAMFDQHAVLSAPPGHGLSVGDMLGFGVSHPCTTFDKWRTLLLVDDHYVVEDVLRTYF